MFQYRCAATAALLFVCALAHASDRQVLSAPLAPKQPVEIMVIQQELAVDVPDTSGIGMQFGLIGALVSSAVDNANTKRAELRVTDIRNQLVDFRFNERLQQAVREKIIAAQLTSDPVVTVRNGAWTGPEAKAAGAAPMQGLIVLTPRYSIANSFENIKVTLALNYVDREIKSNGKLKEKSRFARTYTFSYPLDKINGNNPEQDASRWVALGKPQLEWLLADGIDQVTDMFVYDLTDSGIEESLVSISGYSNLGATSLEGRKVRSGDGWIWTRAKRTRYLTGVRPIGESHPIVITAPPAASTTAAAPGVAPTVAELAAPAVAAPAAPAASAPNVAPTVDAAPATTAPVTPATDAG